MTCQTCQKRVGCLYALTNLSRGLISIENRFALWDFDIEHAPDLEAQLVQDQAGAWGAESETWKSKTEIEDSVLFLS